MIAVMLNPAYLKGETWGFPGEPVEEVETHAAHVLLVDGLAFKIKKDVKLPYLDFSSVEKRRAVLADELAINKAFAPAIYREVKDVDSLEPAAETARFKGSISVLLGEVKVENGEHFHVKGEAWGHGVPTSAIADRWEEEIEPDGTWRFKYLQRNSGYLTEIRQTLQIDLPWHRADSVKFDLGPGETRMRLPKVTEPVRIELLLRETDLTLELGNGVTLWLDPESGGGIEETDATDFPGRVQSPEAAEYRVRLTQREGGRLMIRSAEK